MSKQISPMFALIVIVVALTLGAIYFMYRYRSHEIQWQREAAALQAQATAARQSGRRGMMEGRRAAMGMRTGGRASSERAPSGAPNPIPAKTDPVKE